MKKILFIILALALLSLMTYDQAFAEVFKWIRVGNMHAKIKDNGHQSETQGTGYARYYVGGNTPGNTYGDLLRCAGIRFAVKDWTDQNGKKWNYMIADAPYGTSDEFTSMFATDMGNGIYLKRYWRYPPPQIQVDAYNLSEPILEGDEVAPDKIPGTADVMTESIIRNRIGLEIKARVLAWSQKNHDDYLIWDYTVTNTGNVDQDPEIELPNQTLTGLYIMRQYEIFPNQGSIEWSSWYGCRPGEDLRITYSYHSRAKGSDFDTFGNTQKGTGQIRGPVWAGEAILNISQGNGPDDITQPQMHCVGGPDDYEFKVDAYLLRPEADWELAYKVMQLGYKAHVAKGQNPDYMEGTYPGTHHDKEMDKRGVIWLADYAPWWFWHQVASCAAGPYTLKPGESIRFVRSFVAGSITDEQGWLIGQAWKAGKVKEQYPIDISKLAEYYPPFATSPDVIAPSENDRYKDMWVCTGKDSLFKNARASQWNWKQNYNIPVPPPPPSVTVKSLPDKILVSWDNISESASDFAGYRVYRAVGGYEYNNISGTVIGKFTRVFETKKPNVVRQFEDKSAERGQAYYYYVTAFDDGLQNGPDWDGVVRSLESGHRVNRTTLGAKLTRNAGTSLDNVRIVPNPFNIQARGLQWKGENDRIMFMNLPPVCTIKIYTESGDLVKVLEHTNGSGDESWGVLSQEWSTTQSGQVIVSGIYIANVTTPDGESKNVKFLVVR